MTELTAAPIFHCFPSMSRPIFSGHLLFNDRTPISGKTSERHPDGPSNTIHLTNNFRGEVKCQTKTSVNDQCCVLPDTAPTQADHCLTATSMNKAVSTTHCGIGIVSELIKWEVEWDGQRAEGAWYMLSPDALMASCPAKKQTSGSVFPACTAVIESEQKRQLFSGHQIWTFSG